MLNNQSIESRHIEAFLSGSEEGLNYLFKSYHKPLCWFAKQYVADTAVAEDIVSESFLALWNKRENIQFVKSVKSYLYKIVLNGCLNYLVTKKMKKKSGSVLKQLAEPFTPPHEHNIVRAELMKQILIEMEQLPTECKKVFAKLYIEGKSLKETATELGVAYSTVKNQKYRGLKILRPKLDL